MSQPNDSNLEPRNQRQSRARVFALALLAVVVTTAGMQSTAYRAAMQQFAFGTVLTRGIKRLPVERFNLQHWLGNYEQKIEEQGEELHGAAPINPRNAAGVYLTASSTANERFLADVTESLHDVGANALVIDVKGSYVYFSNTAQLANELQMVRPLYELPVIVKQAKDAGLYTIARYIAVKDPVFSSKYPEVQIRHPETNVSVGNIWVDPSHPLVLSYNREVLQAVAQSGIDEINLDYIRYPTEYTLEMVGLTGDEKADRVEQLIVVAREAIAAAGTPTKLGLSTYAIIGWNFPINHEYLGQDVARFAPLVDIISPMAYPSTFAENAYYNPAVHPRSRNYYLVYRTLTGYQDLLAESDRSKLRPWIQGYRMSALGVRDQIAAVYDSGACGFTVWHANNNYGPFYQAFAGVEVPDECK